MRWRCAVARRRERQPRLGCRVCGGWCRRRRSWKVGEDAEDATTGWCRNGLGNWAAAGREDEERAGKDDADSEASCVRSKADHRCIMPRVAGPIVTTRSRPHQRRTGLSVCPVDQGRDDGGERRFHVGEQS